MQSRRSFLTGMITEGGREWFLDGCHFAGDESDDDGCLRGDSELVFQMMRRNVVDVWLIWFLRFVRPP